MVQTCQTQIPVCWSEGFGAGKHLFDHEDLGAVEDDTGSVAYEEDYHDANKDCRQVHFLVAPLIFGFHMRESTNQIETQEDS